MTETESGTHHGRCDCGCMGAGPAFSRLLRMFTPPEGAGEHFRQSRVEFLKGIRSLLDHQIDQLSKEPNKGKRVVVE